MNPGMRESDVTESEMRDVEMVVRYDHKIEHLDCRLLRNVFEYVGEVIRRRRHRAGRRGMGSQQRRKGRKGSGGAGGSEAAGGGSGGRRRERTVQDMLPGVEIFSDRSRRVAGQRRRVARAADRARVMQQMFATESARRGRWALPDLDPTNPDLTVVPWWTDRELRSGEVRGAAPQSPARARRRGSDRGECSSRIVGVKRSALLAARSGGDKALRTLARMRRCDLGELWQSVCDFDSDYG